MSVPIHYTLTVFSKINKEGGDVVVKIKGGGKNRANHKASTLDLTSPQLATVAQIEGAGAEAFTLAVEALALWERTHSGATHQLTSLLWSPTIANLLAVRIDNVNRILSPASVSECGNSILV